MATKIARDNETRGGHSQVARDIYGQIVKDGGYVTEDTKAGAYGKDWEKVKAAAKNARGATPFGETNLLQTVVPDPVVKAEYGKQRKSRTTSATVAPVRIVPPDRKNPQTFFDPKTNVVQVESDRGYALPEEVSHALNYISGDVRMHGDPGKTPGAYHLADPNESSSAFANLKSGFYQKIHLDEDGNMLKFIDDPKTREIMDRSDGSTKSGEELWGLSIPENALHMLKEYYELDDKVKAGVATELEQRLHQDFRTRAADETYLKSLVDTKRPNGRTMQAADKGGSVSGPKTRGPDPQPAPEPTSPARIVINPKVFKDKRDGLCTAYNEAFRILMAQNGFDPQAEPTEEQRKFFSDTAYADDELMLRRTILARICTFDTSVEDPTDEQLDEAVEFLDAVMEMGAPQTEEEQANVQRIRDIIAKVRQSPRPEKKTAPSPERTQEKTGDGAEEPSSAQVEGGALPGQAPLGAQPE